MTTCARCDWTPDSEQSPAPATQLLEHAVEADHPLCRSCGRSLPKDDVAVCLPCVADARRSLVAVESAYALLPTVFARMASSSDWRRNGPRESEAPLPGGDALSMWGPGSTGAAQVSFGHWPDGTPWLDVAPHADDELADDPGSVAFELWRWELDWRSWRGEPERVGPVTVSGSVEYLNRRLGWAADTHEAFPEFAADLRRMLWRLETALSAGERPDMGAACQSCGVDLQRHYADPKPCEHKRPSMALGEVELPQGYAGPLRLETPADRDARVAAWEKRHAHCQQGGLVEEVWKCPSCQRDYTTEEYRLAVASEMYLKRNAAHYWVPIATAARLAARTHSTVKGWADDPDVAVEVSCDVRTKRLRVLLSSVLAVAAKRRRVGKPGRMTA